METHIIKENKIINLELVKDILNAHKITIDEYSKRNVNIGCFLAEFLISGNYKLFTEGENEKTNARQIVSNYDFETIKKEMYTALYLETNKESKLHFAQVMYIDKFNLFLEQIKPTEYDFLFKKLLEIGKKEELDKMLLEKYNHIFTNGICQTPIIIDDDSFGENMNGLTDSKVFDNNMNKYIKDYKNGKINDSFFKSKETRNIIKNAKKK